MHFISGKTRGILFSLFAIFFITTDEMHLTHITTEEMYNSEDQNNKNVINDTNSSPQSSKLDPMQQPELLQAKIPHSKYEARGHQTCQLSNGTTGVCLKYYLCDFQEYDNDEDNNKFNDERSTQCIEPFEVCCLSAKLTKTTESGVKSNYAVDSCGYSNIGALEFRMGSDDISADFGEFPWMVALLKRSSNVAWTQGDYIGGGSIIHPSVILTAAHKVDNFKAIQIKCRAGEWNTQISSEIKPYQERNVRKIVKHEEFFRPLLYNSIALLFLESPYNFTDAPHIGVACVGRYLPSPGSICYSMGWGVTANQRNKFADVLKKVKLKLKSRDDCQNVLSGTRLGSTFKLHPSLTCALGENGADTCVGDGGSPLVCSIGNENQRAEILRYAVFGMVAYGIGCGTEGVPGVYVNVPSFYDWIAEKMISDELPITSYDY